MSAASSLKMARMRDFYKNWLELNKKENARLTRSSARVPERPQQQQSQPQARVPESQQQQQSQPQSSTAEDLVFENTSLKLYVVKTSFKRQKNFRLQDHHFSLRISLKNGDSNFPKLTDILEFLYAGIHHIISELKSSYKSEEHNIIYLTLFQTPLLSALNTGS